MKRLSKMIFTLVPCFTLIFVTGTSQGGVVGLTWVGTVTADASAGDVYNIDTETYSAHAAAYYEVPPPDFGFANASASVSVSDGETAYINVDLMVNRRFGYGAYAEFWIGGAFTIGSSPEFPVGTPLDLTISGQIAGPFENELYRNGDWIWDRSSGVFTDSYQVFAGDTLILNSRGSSTTERPGEDIRLEVTPEPATLLFLGLGGLILRRRK